MYRLLKAQDLITSPAYIVVKAADAFHDKTTAPNQLWQTDFTYLKVTGWLVLSGFSAGVHVDMGAQLILDVSDQEAWS